ncbi:hypothetical protein ACJX0J_042489, partial [Zea mays]
QGSSAAHKGKISEDELMRCNGDNERRTGTCRLGGKRPRTTTTSPSCSTARASRCPFHLVEKKSQGLHIEFVLMFFRSYISETLQLIWVLKGILIPMKARGKRRSLITSKVGYISETLQPIIEE